MKKKNHSEMEPADRLFLAPAPSAPLSLPTALAPETSGLLLRMFRDPRVLEPEDRAALVRQLQSAVELEPQVAEIRVLLGLALCVDLKVQEALEELRQSTLQAPDCFIARLKFGELLMRLRICDQAAEHTQKAAELATNDVQAELARRQAATIRTMRREGIERGGFRSFVPGWLIPAGRKKSNQQETMPVLAGSK